jgi:hypothetical protein
VSEDEHDALTLASLRMYAVLLLFSASLSERVKAEFWSWNQEDFWTISEFNAEVLEILLDEVDCSSRDQLMAIAFFVGEQFTDSDGDALNTLLEFSQFATIWAGIWGREKQFPIFAEMVRSKLGFRP